MKQLQSLNPAGSRTRRPKTLKENSPELTNTAPKLSALFCVGWKSGRGCPDTVDGRRYLPTQDFPVKKESGQGKGKRQSQGNKRWEGNIQIKYLEGNIISKGNTKVEHNQFSKITFEFRKIS